MVTSGDWIFSWSRIVVNCTLLHQESIHLHSAPSRYAQRIEMLEFGSAKININDFTSRVQAESRIRLANRILISKPRLVMLDENKPVYLKSKSSSFPAGCMHHRKPNIYFLPPFSLVSIHRATGPPCCTCTLHLRLRLTSALHAASAAHPYNTDPVYGVHSYFSSTRIHP